MRMRKLGKGHSVAFCVPEEIKTKILKLVRKPDSSGITVSDILAWAVSETWIDIRRSMPLWAVQGQRFENQSALWTEARTNGEKILSESQAIKFLEDEAQTLEDRYRPRPGTEVSPLRASHNKNLARIMER